MGVAALPPHAKVVVNVENPCSSLCTNTNKNLLAVVGRKGEKMGMDAIWRVCSRLLGLKFG